LSSRLPIGKASLLFSEGPVSLRSSGLHPFGTVLEIRTFGATYGLQRKEVLPLLSDRRGRLISNSPYRGRILSPQSASLGVVEWWPIQVERLPNGGLSRVIGGSPGSQFRVVRGQFAESLWRMLRTFEDRA